MKHSYVVRSAAWGMAFALLACCLGMAASQALAQTPQNSAIAPVPRSSEDWWNKRHEGVLERVKQGNVDLLLIGDSITHGYDGGGKAMWDQYYAPRNAVNMGFSGDQTQHVLWRLDNGEIDGISPKAASIMIGTNNFKANTAEEIAEGVKAIVAKLREKLPNMKILVLAIFPREEKPGETRDKLAKTSELFSTVADGNMVHYMDIGREFLTEDGTLPKEIMPDFLHPNEKGYELWTQAIEPKIAELMGEYSVEKPPLGYVPLFDGKDLLGWRGLVGDPEKRAAMSPEELAKEHVAADQSARDHWKAEDGALVFDGKGESLCTARLYDDFEMLVDWKIESHGDSGIYLRGSPQVQIWDPAQWPQGSGGLYNNQNNPKEPLVCADRPIGEWNRFHIRMIGDKVTVYLNDKMVVDDTVMENYWDRNKPIYAAEQIELQNHGSTLWFKNIFIREIPKGDGWKPLFNGKDLTGWQQIEGEKLTWGGKDGILFTEGGGGGWLSTDREYKNFELELEFNVPENGNSGVFVRAPHQGNPAFEGSEIQVLDDTGSEYTALEPGQYCAGLYKWHPVSRRVSLLPGEWQKYYIRYVGTTITVVQNGWTVQDNVDVSQFPQYFESNPGLKRLEGYIGLQNHGSRLEYRNLRIREL